MAVKTKIVIKDPRQMSASVDDVHQCKNQTVQAVVENVGQKLNTVRGEVDRKGDHLAGLVIQSREDLLKVFDRNTERIVNDGRKNSDDTAERLWKAVGEVKTFIHSEFDEFGKAGEYRKRQSNFDWSSMWWGLLSIVFNAAWSIGLVGGLWRLMSYLGGADVNRWEHTGWGYEKCVESHVNLPIGEFSWWAYLILGAASMAILKLGYLSYCWMEDHWSEADDGK